MSNHFINEKYLCFWSLVCVCVCVLADHTVRIHWSILTVRSRSVVMRRPTCGVRRETLATRRETTTGPSMPCCRPGTKPAWDQRYVGEAFLDTEYVFKGCIRSLICGKGKKIKINEWKITPGDAGGTKRAEFVRVRWESVLPGHKTENNNDESS